MVRRYNPIRRIALAAALSAALPLSMPAPSSAAPLAGPYLAAEQAARRGDIAAAADYYSRALASDAENAVLLERTILHQVAAGRIESAIALARRLSELSDGNQIAMLMLAAEAFKLDRPETILEMLGDERNDTGPFVGFLIEAWAAFAAGDTDEARKALIALREGGSGGAAGEMMAAYHIGLLETAVGDDAAAATAFARTAELANSTTDRLARMRAIALARSGDMDGAMTVLKDRLGRTLGDARLEALLVDLEAGRTPEPLITTGAGGAAEALFGISAFLSRGQNRIIGLSYARLATYLEPDLIDAKLLIAQMLRSDGQNELAIAAYESVPRNIPEALQAQIGRAEAMLAAGMTEPSIVAMREVTARFPRSVEAHTSLGDILRRESRFEEAAVAYNAAIDLTDPIEPRHWVLFYQRGIAYERSDRWDDAEVDFFKALELSPDQPNVLNYLGYSWVELRRNLDQAREMIAKAVDQRPDDGYIVDSLGWVLFRLGDFDGAVRHLERAVELRPVDPVINDHFGDALWMVGRRTEAEFQWKRALSFEPEEKDATRIREKLDRGLDEVMAEEAAAGQPAIIGGDDAGETKKGG
ncbi:MAG: tetratricopeptide repeat protein [Pseudomonadota bacterium]